VPFTDDVISDGGATDDAGRPATVREGGIQCDATPTSTPRSYAALALLALASFARRRRR
jgi:MYXO-CTERM domain-containing protein